MPVLTFATITRKMSPRYYFLLPFENDEHYRLWYFKGLFERTFPEQEVSDCPKKQVEQ